MTTEDPWSGIASPAETGAINARRVPGVGSASWGLYWAIDVRKQCLLILQHRATRDRAQRLPRLRGLLVEEVPTEDAVGHRVVIRLTDVEQREIFHRFCIDIVEATRAAASDEDAIGRFLARTWRWHRLLRTGYDGRLSDEEQKGLIGELRLLETRLLAALPTGDAVESWVGPMDAPKDFQVGHVCIEVKALSPQKAEIAISSINQLDTAGTSRLFLYVSEIAAASSDSLSARSVTDLARRVRTTIEERDASAIFAFETRLNALGFNWEDDYSDKQWIVGDEMLFEVTGGFPRVTPSMVPPGVNDVRYAVGLAACEQYRVDIATVTEAIEGAGNAG